jgi:dihydroorotate dehydrogenase electron transfer subunit
MSHPSNLVCSNPSGMSFVQAELLEHRSIARDTWQLTVRAPQVAQAASPGQFFMVRLAHCNDPLIGRALALYDMHRDAAGMPMDISVVYVVKGKFTQALSRLLPGQNVELWGPLGNSFSTMPTQHLILVAGGVGITPMLTLATAALGKESYGSQPTAIPFAQRVSLCYGARTQEYLAGLDAFAERGVELHVATEDGSLGHAGRVTDVLESLLSESQADVRIACCGPEPMMQAVADVAQRHDTPCEVSLETPMACGIGICFTCVARIQQPDGEWDYRRTCLEGPVFPADKVVW